MRQCLASPLHRASAEREHSFRVRRHVGYRRLGKDRQEATAGERPTTMSVTEHKGWKIESQSYKSAGDRWCPRALVSVFEGGRFYTHDVLALLSLTFDTARDADDYAVEMAKTWIEDRREHHSTRARHGEQVAVPGGLCGVAGQRVGMSCDSVAAPLSTSCSTVVPTNLHSRGGNPARGRP